MYTQADQLGFSRGNQSTCLYAIVLNIYVSFDLKYIIINKLKIDESYNSGEDSIVDCSVMTS